MTVKINRFVHADFRLASKLNFVLLVGLFVVVGTLECQAEKTKNEKTSKKEETRKEALAESKSEKLFLDRLMMVESGGRNFAKNPRSSALGPFQFIRSTFLEVMQKYFPNAVEGKSPTQILRLRVDPAIARQAALAYTRENAVYLSDKGIKPEAGYLRLAFFAGPAAAADVISAKDDALVSTILSPGAISANPFLRGMTAAQLIDRSNREAAGLALLPIHKGKYRYSAKSAHPKIKVRCDLRRASCRKWLHLAKLRLKRKEKRKTKRKKK